MPCILTGEPRENVKGTALSKMAKFFFPLELLYDVIGGIKEADRSSYPSPLTITTVDRPPVCAGFVVATAFLPLPRRDPQLYLAAFATVSPLSSLPPPPPPLTRRCPVATANTVVLQPFL